MGSCSTYDTRKDITSIMKHATLSEAETYGNRLVIVASQRYRYDAIFSPLVDPEIVLSDLQYCILECIGRSRTEGSITQGQFSLQSLSNKDAKQSFYNRKLLHHNYLVSKQIFYYKDKQGQHATGSIFHLHRLHTYNKVISQILTEHIVDILKSKPHYRMEYAEVWKLFPNEAIPKLFKSAEFKRFVRTDVVSNFIF